MRGELAAHEACLYNRGVMCQLRDSCLRCGWDPEVAARRAAAIRAKLNGTVSMTRMEETDARKQHAHDGCGDHPQLSNGS